MFMVEANGREVRGHMRDEIAAWQTTITFKNHRWSKTPVPPRVRNDGHRNDITTWLGKIAWRKLIPDTARELPRFSNFTPASALAVLDSGKQTHHPYVPMTAARWNHRRGSSNVKGWHKFQQICVLLIISADPTQRTDRRSRG